MINSTWCETWQNFIDFIVEWVADVVTDVDLSVCPREVGHCDCDDKTIDWQWGKWMKLLPPPWWAFTGFLLWLHSSCHAHIAFRLSKGVSMDWMAKWLNGWMFMIFGATTCSTIISWGMDSWNKLKTHCYYFTLFTQWGMW